jgi:hypothetical protein
MGTTDPLAPVRKRLVCVRPQRLSPRRGGGAEGRLQASSDKIETQPQQQPGFVDNLCALQSEHRDTGALMTLQKTTIASQILPEERRDVILADSQTCMMEPSQMVHSSIRNIRAT